MSCSSTRLRRLRDALAEEGIDAFLVRDTSNIRWLTDFDGVFDEEDAHALLVVPDDAVLHTDSRYAEAARRAAAQALPPAALPIESDAQVVIPSEANAVSAAEGSRAASAETFPAETPSIRIDTAPVSHARFAADALAARCEAASASSAPLVLGIEDTLALGEFRRLEQALADLPASPVLKETSNLIVRLRAVKDGDEIARMRAAQAITDAAFEHIVGFMRPGMTERQVQIELEDFMVRHGAEGLAFPSIVATGANGASPHAIPGETRLEEGQCVVLDFGARARGYCSDMTRTVFLGEPSPPMRAAYETLQRANEQAKRLIKPGVTGKEAHESAERALEEGGFGGKMGHSLGHGVGLDIHEEPVLSPRNDAPLEPGNVVTVEPGIYLPSEFGMRLEDCGVVTEDGFDVFTQSTRDMVIIER